MERWRQRNEEVVAKDMRDGGNFVGLFLFPLRDAKFFLKGSKNGIQGHHVKTTLKNLHSSQIIE
jgi:hypothetical protein